MISILSGEIKSYNCFGVIALFENQTLQPQVSNIQTALACSSIDNLATLYVFWLVTQCTLKFKEAQWPRGRASDSGARGRGFDPHSGHRVVFLSKLHLSLKKYW